MLTLKNLSAVWPPHRISLKPLAVALFLLCAVLFGVAQDRGASGCLSYEPAVVSLKGTLVRQTFPGPPNYESIKNGDKPETSWLLDLPQSICVNQDKDEPDTNPAQKAIRKVQLVLTPEFYKQYSALLGKSVVASGTLFGQETGHHHTPVLLTVSVLKAQ